MMFKNPMSILITAAIVFGTVFNVSGQGDDKSYRMWEDMMFTPDNTHIKLLSDNIRKHNQKYHTEGAYKATVYNIATGPNAGKIIWEMGALHYGDLDKRPGVDGHDEDWRDNVMPYIKEISTVEYWKADKKLNNTGMLDGDNSKYPILFCRYYEVVDEPAPGLSTFFERTSKTVKALEGTNPWGLYYNEFRQGSLGRHIVTISFIPNWADFDRDVNWVDTFNKVNGEDSWRNQQDLYTTSFKNVWDEVWVYDKYMSGQ